MPYIGGQSTANSKIKKSRFTATASQTAFSVASNAGDELQVFLNGVLLKETDDYTYTTSTVTLGTGATVSDIVEVHVYQSFTIADTVDIAGGTMTGELEVPTVKLSSNVIKASDGGSTITLDDSDNVTLAGNLVIPDGGNIGSASDTDAIAISSGGNVTLSQTLDGGEIGSAVTMSANQACVKTALNASGSAPIYACRVWVNFDGTSGSGTGNSNITIRGSGNVTSVTDRGTGSYQINFTTDMPDTNYCAVLGSGAPSSQPDYNVSAHSYLVGSIYMEGSLAQTQASPRDIETANLAIFR